MIIRKVGFVQTCAFVVLLACFAAAAVAQDPPAPVPQPERDVPAAAQTGLDQQRTRTVYVSGTEGGTPVPITQERSFGEHVQPWATIASALLLLITAVITLWAACQAKKAADAARRSAKAAHESVTQALRSIEVPLAFQVTRMFATSGYSTHKQYLLEGREDKECAGFRKCSHPFQQLATLLYTKNIGEKFVFSIVPRYEAEFLRDALLPRL
jgi:hypothetical protein